MENICLWNHRDFNKASKLGSLWSSEGVLWGLLWDFSGALRRRRGRQAEQGKGGRTFLARAARSRAKRGSAQRMTQSYVCPASGQIRKARAKVNDKVEACFQELSDGVSYTFI